MPHSPGRASCRPAPSAAGRPAPCPGRSPKGSAATSAGDSDLVLQVHYHPDGKDEVDQSVVGITFTKAPAKKIVAGIAVRSQEIYIPAGEARHHVQAESEPLPVDVDALGIFPHMHNVGREFKVVAESPDGKTIPLIWIKDWDFNWQGQYLYQKPIRLAKGTVIKVDAYYDNSTANPRNPSNPPKLVQWGEQTTDEMCLVMIQVVADTLPDLRKIMAMNLVSALANPAGFPIPERFKELLTRFDTDNNGRLSPAEVDAMPEPLKLRIRQAVQNRMNGGEGNP